MAPFLEHIFTFHRRDDPHLQSSFKSEDYIWIQDATSISGSTLTSPSSARIQHCFNLVGLEYDAGSNSFLYRQTAVYYALDLVSGQTVCIVLKANRVVSQSIVDFTKDLAEPAQLSTPEGMFLFGLQCHLLIYEWVIQNWTPYINSIQKKCSELSNAASYTPVTTKTDDEAIGRIIKRMSTMKTDVRQNSAIQSHQNTGLQGKQAPLRGWDKMIPLREFASRQAKRAIPGTKTPETDEDTSADIKQIFSFDKLQLLHHQAEKIQEGLLVLEQNKTVLSDMMKHFQNLQRSKMFRQRVKMENYHLQMFLHKTERCIAELESQQKRLSALQAELERVISLVRANRHHGCGIQQ